ncbi:L-aspartate oxidase [Mycetocola manganoxydans]|uniref:L-aspartate oxidase n=1 Tax=Mycetocola manganoxydans TaxID=699879 RepID=A0A3L6ZT82_9MICO|nr:L-aspartate oxidase [Mycetocola manganoxydans]RLP70845.1 L-aspartate oxidase [Mycetocola manganoxydans]
MTRVIVVGSGIAGLTAALHASQRHDVLLVTKSSLGQSNTRYAQGGIAGVMFDDDSVEAHIADTLSAGAGLCDEAAVRVLCSEGPARIRQLIALGVEFDRTDGEFARGREAAHSYPRVLHAGGDATGARIEQALVARVLNSGVRIAENTFLVDLLLTNGTVSGVALRDADGMERDERADAVLLATGGAGQLYPFTTNPSVATGDGAAAALRAGALLADLEFYQFHPTALTTGDHFLVSEAVRGEGAVLRNAIGERFLPALHPAAELAPRDVVARGIAAEMAAQGGLPVVLDATALGAEFLAHRFPVIDRAVRASGIDWSREPVPVSPAAHYWMGGVVTDLDGRTTVPGLYAVGEVARTGVHGANRLASNSLLEGAVFGARAAAALDTDNPASWPVAPPPLTPAPERTPALDAPSFSRDALQRVMWDAAGLLRDDAGLTAAAGILDAWSAAPVPTGSIRDLEDRNLLALGRELVSSALARTESVGAHARSDSPAQAPVAATREVAAAC